MPFPVSRTGMRTSCPFQSPSPTSWTIHVHYAYQLFNGGLVLLIQKAIIVQFYLAEEASSQPNCQMLDNGLFFYFEFDTLCPFGYTAQRRSYLQSELIQLNNIIWLLIIQLYWFMSCNGRSPLYRYESSSEMRPEDQLYQISIMGSEYQEQNRFGKLGAQDNKQTKRRQAKIVNRKSIEQDNQSIVQWMDLCGANQRLRKQRKKKVKKAQNNGEAKSESPGLNASDMYKIIVKNSKDQCDNKFMSMAELCHRYTFVNEHGGHSKYFAAQKKSNNSNQIKQQSQSYLKGSFNEYQEEMLYKTKYNFLGQSKNLKQIKLPSVKKAKDKQDNKKSQAEYLQKILKFLQKSNSKKKIEVRFTKNLKETDDIDLKIDNLKNKQPNKQKINWKKSQRYNGKPQEDMQLSLSKSQKSILDSKELNPNRSSSEMKCKKILISMKGAGLDYSLRNQKVNKRISKSLQQCLILSKK